MVNTLMVWPSVVLQKYPPITHTHAHSFLSMLQKTFIKERATDIRGQYVPTGNRSTQQRPDSQVRVLQWVGDTLLWCTLHHTVQSKARRALLMLQLDCYHAFTLVTHCIHSNLHHSIALFQRLQRHVKKKKKKFRENFQHYRKKKILVASYHYTDATGRAYTAHCWSKLLTG